MVPNFSSVTKVIGADLVTGLLQRLPLTYDAVTDRMVVETPEGQQDGLVYLVGLIEREANRRLNLRDP